MLADSEKRKLVAVGLKVVKWERFMGIVKEWHPESGWQIMIRSTSASKVERTMRKLKQDPSMIVLGER